MGKPTGKTVKKTDIFLVLARIVFFFSLFLFVSTSTLLIFSKIPLNSPIPPKPPISPLPSSSQTTTTVRTVSDGDTVYSADFKAGIRLIGINAPEMANSYSCGNGQTRGSVPTENCTNECGAPESTEKLKNLILGKEVFLVKDKLDKVDVYGRLLRYIYLCPSTPPNPTISTMNYELITQSCQDINLEMLKSGFAEENAYRKHFEKEKEYIEAEKEAKAKKMGIWNECQ